ncbi:MAG: hypothetical protein HOO93_05060 [Methyloglobulus sp.]|nr:hypothetical protein [Methyloglobulus sp.]
MLGLRLRGTDAACLRNCPLWLANEPDKTPPLPGSFWMPTAVCILTTVAQMLLPPPPCVGILALASRLCQGSLRYTTFLDKAESPRRTTPTAVGGKSIPTGRVCSGTHPRCGYGRAGSDMKTALWFSNFPRRQSAAFSR